MALTGGRVVAAAATTLLARITGAWVTIAHASQPEVVESSSASGRRARAWTWRLARSTCCSTMEVVRHGPTRKFTPPARPAPAADRLWELLESGAIDLLSSDHAPSTLAQKHEGDIWECLFGLPGVDTTFPLMLDAVVRGRLSLGRLVTVDTANPRRPSAWRGARGARPRGGRRRRARRPRGPPHARRRPGLSKAGWTPYAGRELRGAVVTTLLRGVPVAEHGAPVAEPGTGVHVAP